MRTTMHQLLACARKEMLVILRDREALAVLFLMPIAFVLIMSIALQDAFNRIEGIGFDLTIIDADRGATAGAIIDRLAVIPVFRVAPIPVGRDVAAVEAQVRREIRAGERRFALLLPEGLSARVSKAVNAIDPARLAPPAPGDIARITLLADPVLRPDHVALARTVIERVIQGVEIQFMAVRFGGEAAQAAFDEAARGNRPAPTSLIAVGADTERAALPSSTQQNVPAYTLLAMFLLVVPLAGAFIREREQGSLARLASMPLPGWAIIGGKIIPYFVLNQIQMVLLFVLVGRIVLPQFGVERLVVSGSTGGVIVLSFAASLAAIGFGLLVAVWARTQEQATAFGAAAVLILAALGGVMVPKMLMPGPLQTLAAISPLGIALDGFLDVFVRAAQLVDVLPRAAILLGFAALCLAASMFRFNRLARGR